MIQDIIVLERIILWLEQSVPRVITVHRQQLFHIYVKVMVPVQKVHHHHLQQLKTAMLDTSKILILAAHVWQALFAMLDVRQSIL